MTDTRGESHQKPTPTVFGNGSSTVRQSISAGTEARPTNGAAIGKLPTAPFDPMREEIGDLRAGAKRQE